MHAALGGVRRVCSGGSDSGELMLQRFTPAALRVVEAWTDRLTPVAKTIIRCDWPPCANDELNEIPVPVKHWSTVR